MKPPSHRPNRGLHLLHLAALLACSALGGTASAQTTAPDQATSNNSDEGVVTLSPFEVRGENDNGYQSTSTLAGTRLRSDLKDLANSISVINKNFMTDINATDSTSLFVYTLGTEVGGFGGNYSNLEGGAGVFDDALGQITPGVRVRGLLTADRTRDYFSTDIPMDGYNVDRVEISRGPNATLFGLGSPAGIINQALIKADTRGTKTTVTGQYGSYGSYRGVLDHNQVLMKDKLAVRLASVYNGEQYRADPAYDRLRAATLTTTYRPLENTVIQATVETGRDTSNRPDGRPPYDAFSYWWAMGKPVWDPTTGTGHLLGTPQAPYTTTSVFNANGTRNTAIGITSPGIGGWSSNEPGLFYQDPNSSTLGGLDIGGGTTVDGVKAFATNAFLFPGATTLGSGGMIALRQQTNALQNVYHATDPGKSFYNRAPQITDPSIFDFYHDMLPGTDKQEWSKWAAYNLTVNQTFWNNKAGIEAIYDKQIADWGWLSPADYGITLDINEKLPNGAPNPNFLRPVIAGTGFINTRHSNREAERITGFYDLDLRKVGGRHEWIGKILGDHMFNVNYTRQDQAFLNIGGTPWDTGIDYVVAEGGTPPGDVSSTARIVGILSYLGPSVANASGPQDVTIQGIHADHNPTGLTQMTILNNKRPATNAASALNPWSAQTFGLITSPADDLTNTGRAGYSSRTEQQIHSTAAVAQSHWLENTIVTTASWRKDEVWSLDSGSAPTNLATGTVNLDPTVWYPKLSSFVSEESHSWGIVGHTPQFIKRHLPLGIDASIFYNSSSNFRVSPQRYNIRNEPLGPEIGDTKEYGAMVSVFDDKFELRVTHYETKDANSTVTENGFLPAINELADSVGNVIDQNYTVGSNTANPAGIAAFENWLNSPNGLIFQNTFAYQLTPNTDPTKPVAQYGHYSAVTHTRGNNVVGTSALDSTGMEYELTWNPTPNWRLTANASKAEAVRTDIAPEIYDFLLNPTTGLLGVVQTQSGGQTDAGRLNMTANSTGAITDYRSYIVSNVVNPMLPTFLKSGSKTDELREWHWAAVTNYTFSDSSFLPMLKGFNIGGAVRWMDKVVIGYPTITLTTATGATLTTLDVSKPYYGPSQSYYDAWIGYDRQLTKRIGWKVQLNLRNIGVGNKLIPIYANPDGTTAMWRIAEPMQWTLTNTFTF
ncbi:MAG TPA: TonB-dependent receptor plug domain-containing protein [Opitutus sp.]|nr:TonB-dependent receptor plug domain-containing protein [Opitutus sp.]